MTATAGGEAAGVTVFGLDAGAFSAVFGATGFGFSATQSIIKTWEGGAHAKVAALSIDTGKYVASEFGGHVAEHAIKNALKGRAHSAQIIKSAEGQIRKLKGAKMSSVMSRAYRRDAIHRECFQR
jgi:2C-methyl-D-erythritol 2,4-cyclodiphosphate synthase